jgi:hypothetical protein
VRAREEFLAFLSEASGTHAFAVRGLKLMRREVETQKINVARGNTLLVGWARDNPNRPGDILSRPGWGHDQFLSNLGPDGISMIYLGWAWITLVFGRWEDDYRHRFAKDMGCSHGEVKCDAMGDLRYLRNDVTHNKGVATREWSGRCVLLHDWFVIGQVIRITDDKIASFYDIISADDTAFYV